MRDLQSRGLMWLKAALFLLIGVLSVVLILIQMPDWRVVVLLTLAIWSFCRAYYFAFYVLKHYVDPSFRYAGLISMIRYLWTREPKKASPEESLPK